MRLTLLMIAYRDEIIKLIFPIFSKVFEPLKYIRGYFFLTYFF